MRLAGCDPPQPGCDHPRPIEGLCDGIEANTGHESITQLQIEVVRHILAYRHHKGKDAQAAALPQRMDMLARQAVSRRFGVRLWRRPSPNG
jgi:hypothetical protein